MSKKKRIGDTLDYLAIGALGLVMAPLVKQTAAQIKAERRSFFAQLPEDKVRMINEEVSPLLAGLRRTILAAYDPKTQSIDSGAVGKALNEAAQAVNIKLQVIFKGHGMMDDETMLGLTAGFLVATEATLALKEQAPTKGSMRG